MSRYFAQGRRPWFRIGSFEVGTTELVAAACVVSMIVSAIWPEVLATLAFFPGDFLRGQVWQAVTWPLANPPGLPTVWSIAVFWWMGRTLEAELGRRRFGVLLLGITASQAVLAVVFGLILWQGIALAGIGTIAMLVVLVAIAENPRAPFFFGIPAWVLGLVMVGLPILTSIAGRQWLTLLVFLGSIVVTAVLGRTFGLLARYRWIPSLAWTPRRARTRTASSKGGRVYQGPWTPQPDSPVAEDREMDDLLDKIGSFGLDSLTPRERARLDELRRKRRGQ